MTTSPSIVYFVLLSFILRVSSITTQNHKKNKRLRHSGRKLVLSQKLNPFHKPNNHLQHLGRNGLLNLKIFVGRPCLAVLEEMVHELPTTN